MRDYLQVFLLYLELFSCQDLLIKKLLPSGISLHLGFVAIISIVSASVYAQHSANASHWAGFIFGVILSIWLRPEEIVFTEVDLLDFDCL